MLSEDNGLISFNMNDYVLVRLTDYGKECLKAGHDNLNKISGFDLPYTPPEEDAEGWSKFQFWVLIQRFGEHIGMACQPVFETKIKIYEPLSAITKPEAGE